MGTKDALQSFYKTDFLKHMDKVLFYQSLHGKLVETCSWPHHYTFKFIVPNSEKLIAEVMVLFPMKETSISTRNSSKGKYVSITAKLLVETADEIIAIYQKAESIEGIVAL